MSYKEAQEAFVANLSGTSVTEIFMVSAALPPLCNFFYFTLLGVLSASSRKWLNFVMQFLLLVVPILLFFTCLADLSHVIGFLLPGAVPLVLLFYSRLRTSSPPASESSDMTAASSAVTAFRAYTNIATAVAILAVDFTVFPRRFAKVETFGTGLMDVGVGLYVFSMALVSREARRQPGEGLVRGWKTLVALLVLGTGRLVTTKAAAYQEHASEYGVHWNFFFTLAALKILALVVGVIWKSNKQAQGSLDFWSPLFVAAVFGVGYQVLLQRFGVSSFIQHSWDGSGSRHDFLSANREGILSTLGYFTLYCAAVQVGRCLWSCTRKATLLVAFTIVSAFLLYALEAFGLTEAISRRMANLPFILWQISHGSAVLLGFYLLYSSFRSTPRPNKPAVHPAPPLLLSAISKQQLLFFLAANLLTGTVNMSIQTIYAPPGIALVVLSCYLFTLCLMAIALHWSSANRSS